MEGERKRAGGMEAGGLDYQRRAPRGGTEELGRRHGEVQEAWAAVENRSNVPDDFVGSIAFRKEPVMPPLMLDFMSRTACRRATHSQKGSLLRELKFLLDCRAPAKRAPHVTSARSSLGLHSASIACSRTVRPSDLNSITSTGSNYYKGKQFLGCP